MDLYVARLNIEHLRKQVSEECDPAKREVLSTILAEEEAALASILEKRKKEVGNI